MKLRWMLAQAIVAVFVLASCSLAPASTLAPPPSPTTVPTTVPATSTQEPLATVPSVQGEPTVQDTAQKPVATEVPTDSPLPTDVPTETPAPSADPFPLISSETLFAYLEDLTAIQPYSGWRNSATEGEAEALDYVEEVLGGFGFLQGLGLELDRQSFRVFMGTELWESRLHLNVDGQEVEVPTSGLRGPRDDVGQALRFDSDGALNDVDRDPVMVEGPALVVRTIDEIEDLRRNDVEGRVVFLDYTTVDRVVQGGTQRATEIAWDLVEEGPAGLVLVTTFSNQIGRSHGSFVSDVSALNWVATEEEPPILYVRLEDLDVAGINDWDDLARIEAVRLTWDADVFSPALSGNLVARIPGADSTRAIILGAHIDSPNAAGAMDDGSGSVVLLEVARVLDASRTQPPVDVYLTWFGSEEIGLYGSTHFVSTYQEVLDQTDAMLQTDMLSHPLDGINAAITLVTWSYDRLGDGRVLWPDHLVSAAAAHGIEVDTEDLFYIYSDNSSFGGYDVPHADQIYVNESEMEATGSLHYAAHIHDPYDTVELAREMEEVLVQMAELGLIAALEPGDGNLRVTQDPDRRALFVASHTESGHMTPAALTELGMSLAMEGFDVDLIPYGQAVTAEDLETADLVVALPIVDYPGLDSDTELYDEAWTDDEIAALEAYVQDGGLLVLTNSAHRLKYSNRVLDANEDWPDANKLAERFGVTYLEGTFSSTQAWVAGDHPLTRNLKVVEMIEGNGLPFDPGSGQVLAEAGNQPAMALLDAGQGQVLVLADLGLLGATWGPPANLELWRNLANYAR